MSIPRDPQKPSMSAGTIAAAQVQAPAAALAAAPAAAAVIAAAIAVRVREMTAHSFRHPRKDSKVQRPQYLSSSSSSSSSRGIMRAAVCKHLRM